MAKSYNGLWERMVDPDNIEGAIYAAAKGKKRKREVQDALADVPATVARVKGMLERDEWRPPEVRDGRFYKDGIARKKRLLVEPDFDEQIVHHLLIDYIIEPIFMPGFYEWSCGSIPGRGQEMMAKHIMRKIRRGGAKVKYCAVLDIAKCFPSIDIETIYKAIATKIRDRRVLRLVRMILEANTIRLPDGTIMKGGVPIGLFTSPWFVNIALTAIDRRFKSRKGKRKAVYLYVRYIDDMLMMHGNKRELKGIIGEVAAWLNENGMRLKARAVILRFDVYGSHKVRYTGFHVTRQRMMVRDRVFIRAQRTGARIRRKIARRIRVTAHDAERLISYGGRFRSFGSYGAFPARVLRGIRFSDMRRKVSVRDSLRSMKSKIKEAEHAMCV